MSKDISENYIIKTNKNLITFLKNEKVSATQLKQMVDYLPSANNQNGWKIVNSNGNNVTKTELINSGGNGKITKVVNGQEVEYADVIQGSLVFRESQIKGVVKLDTQFVKNRTTNFNNLDEALAKEVRTSTTSTGYVQEIRNWLKANKINYTTIEKDTIRQYRESLNLTWHECSDSMTGQLVRSDIHTASKGGITHLGGISELG